jgi:hypothetical protein
MTTTNLRKDIEKILLKYGHYHDIMADELEEIRQQSYVEGFTKGMNEGYLDSRKVIPESYRNGKKDAVKEIKEKIKGLRGRPITLNYNQALDDILKNLDK